MKKSGNVDGNVVKPQTHFGNYIFKTEKKFLIGKELLLYMGRDREKM
jgi:hypothetical protein